VARSEWDGFVAGAGEVDWAPAATLIREAALVTNTARRTLTEPPRLALEGNRSTKEVQVKVVSFEPMKGEVADVVIG
jgi:hypothetical protein